MRTQLKVIKADGSVEGYLHTKIIGAISNALAQTGEADICAAEQLAEAVTYFLYHQRRGRRATSSEIFSIVKAVLTSTGYEDAAIAISEYHFERQLKRSRIDVVSVDVRELADAGMLAKTEESAGRSRWDKSRIVADLVTKHKLGRQTARMIAAMVEEKILNMGSTLVPAGLIKQLVLGDAAAVLRAQRQLQTV